MLHILNLYFSFHILLKCQVGHEVLKVKRLLLICTNANTVL